MFGQIFIIMIGVSLVVMGLSAGDYVSVLLGLFMAVMSVFSLYVLKTGKLSVFD